MAIPACPAPVYAGTMKRSLVLAALGALMAGAAIAGPGNEPMTEEALREELFGIRMSGIVLGTSIRWRECVEPGGRTLYEIEGDAYEGRLEITAEAQACFTYEATGTSCFRGQRAPKGFLFHPVGGGNTFSVTKVERGVKKCIASDLIG